MKYWLLLSIIILTCCAESTAQVDSMADVQVKYGTITVRKKTTEATPKQDKPLLLIVRVTYPEGRKKRVPLTGAFLSLSSISLNNPNISGNTNNMGLGSLAFTPEVLSRLNEKDTLTLNVFYAEQVVATAKITMADMARQYEVELGKEFAKNNNRLSFGKNSRRKRISSNKPEAVSVLSQVGE